MLKATDLRETKLELFKLSADLKEAAADAEQKDKLIGCLRERLGELDVADAAEKERVRLGDE